MQVELVPGGLGDDYFLLFSELDDLDHDGLEEVAAESAPDGARGNLGEVVAVIVTLAGSPVLGTLVALVQDWLSRRSSGTISIGIGDDRLEMTAVASDMQREALAAFLARHSE